MKKKISIIVCIILVVAVVGLVTIKIKPTDKTNENAIIEESNTSDISEVIVTEETEEIVRDTIQATQEGEDVSTTEVIESSEEEEQNIVDEGATEGYSEQMDNISYDGTNTGNGLSLLGAYQGLTYYSQADSRWANIPYTSCGNNSQTMKSSACGPTSAAIVVSSSKGAILPTTMANLFVSNGYRTANNGTAWAAMSFIADYFDISEYYTTSSYSTMYSYLRQDKDNDGQSDYYAIAACSSGLWTTGGHYITIVADNGGTLTVYDPYLYSGKFNTASRRAAGVVVSGNSAYVSENSFSTYSNASRFWIYSNDKGSGNTNTNNSGNNASTNVNYTRYVATQSLPLNVRNTAGGSIIGSLSRGTKVTVTKIYGNWSYITSPKTGWISTAYLSTLPVTSTSGSSGNYSTSVGNTYKLNSTTTLYSKGNLSGTTYTYLANTKCKVISHYNTSVDYIYIAATGRYAYVRTNALSGTSTTSSNSSTNTSTGNYATLKGTTKLYANSSMSGTYYTYIANTKLKVLSHISSSIDKVQVVKTGRVAYVYTSNYKGTTTTSTSTNTTGSYKTLKGTTTLYKNSSMSGTYYTYLANTQVKIIKNISSSVDYIYVTKTGRYAYCYKSAYK